MINTEKKWDKKLVWCIEEHLICLMACYSRHTYPDIFWIRNLSFLNTASVQTHPVNPAYESATFWIRSPEWKFLNTLWIRNRGNAKFEYFLSGNKIEPSSLPWILCSVFKMATSLPGCLSYPRRRRSRRGPWERGCSRWLPPCHACSVVNIPRGVLGTRANPDTCGRVNSIWIRIRVDVEIFIIWKEKSCGFKNIRIRVDGA